jgi:hypothetical protein
MINAGYIWVENAAIFEKHRAFGKFFKHIYQQLDVVRGIVRGKAGFLNFKFKLEYCLHAPFLRDCFYASSDIRHAF